MSGGTPSWSGLLLAICCCCTAAASPCSSTCEDLYKECVQDSQGNGYTTCRRMLETGNEEFVAAGCKPGCADTSAMAALVSYKNEGSEEGAGEHAKEEEGEVVATGPVCDSRAPVFGTLPFAKNAAGAAQLMPCSLCEAWSARKMCEVRYDVPAACAGNAGKSCPLVFFFHGGGGRIEVFGETASPLLHARTRFIGVYVQGDVAGGGPGWTGGQSDDRNDPDDLGFVLHVIELFRTRFGWDSRLYAYGYSSGAALTQRIASNGRMGFTAMAVVATQLLLAPLVGGPPPLNHNRPSDAACTRPIGVVSFHGTQDDVIPYGGSGSAAEAGGKDGGKDADGDDFGDGQLDSVDGSMRAWASNNDCDTPATHSSAALRASTEVDGGQSSFFPVQHQTWTGCTMPTENYKIVNGGHDGMEMLDIGNETVMALALSFFATNEALCSASVQCPGRMPSSVNCTAALKIQPQAARKDTTQPPVALQQASHAATSGPALLPALLALLWGISYWAP